MEAELIAEGQVQSTATAVSVPSGFGTEYPPPHSVYSELDNYLRGVLDSEIGGDAEKKLAWAIRTRSVSEANRLHEGNFRVMFGSQLKALRVLNSFGQQSVADFAQHYEEARKDPETAAFHEARTFDQWKAFLVQTRYIVDVENGSQPAVAITAFGQNFLLWITESRVWDYRAG